MDMPELAIEIAYMSQIIQILVPLNFLINSQRLLQGNKATVVVQSSAATRSGIMDVPCAPCAPGALEELPWVVAA